MPEGLSFWTPSISLSSFAPSRAPRPGGHRWEPRSWRVSLPCWAALPSKTPRPGRRAARRKRRDAKGARRSAERHAFRRMRVVADARRNAVAMGPARSVAWRPIARPAPPASKGLVSARPRIRSAGRPASILRWPSPTAAPVASPARLAAVSMAPVNATLGAIALAAYASALTGMKAAKPVRGASPSRCAVRTMNARWAASAFLTCNPGVLCRAWAEQ